MNEVKQKILVDYLNLLFIYKLIYHLMQNKNLPKINKNIDKYELMENIGQGQYGNVYKAKLKDSEEFYAVKVMPV